MKSTGHQWRTCHFLCFLVLLQFHATSHFFRKRPVLCLNRLAEKTRYLSCWCVVALLRHCPALLDYWPVSRNLHHTREISLGDNPNPLATRRTDEPSWSNWTAKAISQGCRYLMMLTVEVIGQIRKESAELATYTLSAMEKCLLHLGQWQWNWFTNGQASQLVWYTVNTVLP